MGYCNVYATSHNMRGMGATTEIIRALRASGLTQSEIARRTSIPQPRLSRWENGEAPESADDALRLHALHAELIGAEGAPDAPALAAEASDAG